MRERWAHVLLVNWLMKGEGKEEGGERGGGGGGGGGGRT